MGGIFRNRSEASPPYSRSRGQRFPQLRVRRDSGQYPRRGCCPKAKWPQHPRTNDHGQRSAKPRHGRLACPNIESCRLTVVEVAQSAKSFALSHRPAGSTDCSHWNDEAIVESLMIPFHVVMGNEFSNGFSQRIFTKEDHLLQAAFIDRANEAFAIRI